jgi:arylsulfatase A-like enzyme
MGFPLARGLVLACLAGLAACDREAAPRGAPSFVLVLADDLGWADVGFQGSSYYRTPALDRLAAEGLVFREAYAPSPVCSPSRAALVTGLAPARLGITAALGPRAPTDESEERSPNAAGLVAPSVRDGLPRDSATLATRLAERGYRTAWIGKWHLSGSPREHGFQIAVADSSEGAVRSHFSPYGIRGFADGPRGEYLTERLTDEALRFVESCGEEPFLLVLAHFAPHLPLEAPAELVAECQARAEPAARQRNPLYAAMIECLDTSVARLRAALEARAASRESWLIFTSDNGGFEERRVERPSKVVGREASSETYLITSNAPLRGGKGHLLEGGLRVPLVFWRTGEPRPRVCAEPVSGLDLAPTLLDLAGASALEPCDGQSLVPILSGADELARDTLYFHFPHQASQSALRRGDEKLLYHWRDGRAELYDLARDVGEAHDLATQRPARAAELEAELFRWLTSVSAGLPERAR